jgi:hypothetical protein
VVPDESGWFEFEVDARACLAINISAVSDVVNGHLFGILVDAIDHAVVANADPVESF